MGPRIRNRLQSFFGDRHFRDILFGSSLSFFYRIVLVVVNLGGNLILVRSFGTEAVGDIALLMALVLALSHVSLLGSHLALSKFLPEHLLRYSPRSAFRIMKTIFLFMFRNTTVFTIILILFSGPISLSVFGKPEIRSLLFTAGLTILFFNPFQVNLGSLRGLQAYSQSAFLSVFPFLVFPFLLGTAAFIRTDRAVPPRLFLASAAIGFFVSLHMLYRRYRLTVGNSPAQSVHTVKIIDILRVAMPLFLLNLIHQLIPQVDTLLMGAFHSQNEVGVFGVLLKFTQLTSFFAISFQIYLLPKFSEMIHSGQEKEAALLARRTSKLIFWGLLVFTIIIFGIGRFVLLLFGPIYATAHPLLLLLLLGQTLYATTSLAPLYLSITPAKNVVALISIVSLGTHFLLQSWLIPKFGISGATIGEVITLSIGNLILCWVTWKKTGHRFFFFPGLG